MSMLWPKLAAAFVFLATLNRDAVVADVDLAIGDAHVAAGVGVDAVGVWRIRGVLNLDAVNIHVVAGERADRPHRRIRLV